MSCEQASEGKGPLEYCTRFLGDLPPSCSRGEEEARRTELLGSRRTELLGSSHCACDGQVTSEACASTPLRMGPEACEEGGVRRICLRGAHVMSHVVAVENGCARDVTRRYVRRWEDVVTHRMDDKHGTLQDLLFLLSRRRVRVEEDSVLQEEEREFWELGLAEELPTSAAAFAVSPYFALLGRLRDTEMLRPSSSAAPFFAGTGAQGKLDGMGAAVALWGGSRGGGGATACGLRRGLVLGTLVVDGEVETIISRQHVAVLRTREQWCRRLSTVRQGEKPVRVLKDKLARLYKQLRGPDSTLMQLQRASLCELYGDWQVDVLHVGVAVNSTVPKNGRGHVELLSAHHLPHGCAWLPFARAALAARRLKVDYAPALVGWVLRAGRSLPLFHGVVVCVQHQKDVAAACASRVQDEVVGVTPSSVHDEQEETVGEYEVARSERIRHNKQVLADLGIVAQNAEGQSSYGGEPGTADANCARVPRNGRAEGGAGGGESRGLGAVEAQRAGEVMAMWGDMSIRVLKCLCSFRSCGGGEMQDGEALADQAPRGVAAAVLDVLSALELELAVCDAAYPASSSSAGWRVRVKDRGAGAGSASAVGADAKALAKASITRVLLPLPSVICSAPGPERLQATRPCQYLVAGQR